MYYIQPETELGEGILSDRMLLDEIIFKLMFYHRFSYRFHRLGIVKCPSFYEKRSSICLAISQDKPIKNVEKLSLWRCSTYCIFMNFIKML